MPGCNWCNEHNCPATEENVSGKNRWFFAKSKEKLIKEINTKCAKICGECAEEVKDKLERSGKPKGRFGMTNWRNLSLAEKEGLKKLYDKYNILGSMSPAGELDEDFKRYYINEYMTPMREQDILQNYMNPAGNYSLTKDPDDYPHITARQRELNYFMASQEVAVEMKQVFERGGNFVTWLICRGNEPRTKIPKNTPYNKRIEKGIEVGSIEVNNGDYYLSQELITQYTKSEGQQSQKDWTDIWAMATYHEADLNGKIDPGVCEELAKMM